MTITAHLPQCSDLSHHVNSSSKSRQVSPLKAMYEFSALPGMTSLAGGLPHTKLFPFRTLTAGVYPADVSFSTSNDDALERLDMPDMGKALQYSAASGLPSLTRFIREWVQTIFSPATFDWEILVNHGSTQGWASVVRLLCEPDDWILTESHTFPSAMGAWVPLGIRGAPVQMDGAGMRSDDLRRVLEDWHLDHPGVRRPRLMYIVSVGSNPTGSTMPAWRRREIYDICVEYDIIICQDEPYYFLQHQPYVLGEQGPSPTPPTAEQFKAALEPSFLHFDYQVRVIHLDSFSKTLAPGCRLGFFVANPVFIERLTRAAEVEIQAPNGWSQAIVSDLLGNSWGVRGYLTWLAGLSHNYTVRRNEMCNAIASSFDLRPASTVCIKGADSSSLVAFSKGTDVPIFSFVPPSGGMFLWLRLWLVRAPRFVELRDDEACIDPEVAFIEELWAQLAQNKVLLAPGFHYEPWQGADKATTATRGGERGVGCFRLAFSMAEKEEMEAAIERMANTFREVWAL